MEDFIEACGGMRIALGSARVIEGPDVAIMEAINQYVLAQIDQTPYLAGKASANDPAFTDAVERQGASWRAFLLALQVRIEAEQANLGLSLLSQATKEVV